MLVSRSFLPEPLHASIAEKMMLHGSKYASKVEEVIVPMNPGPKFCEAFSGVRKLHFSNPNAWYFNEIRTGQFPHLKKVTFQESKKISVAAVGRNSRPLSTELESGFMEAGGVGQVIGNLNLNLNQSDISLESERVLGSDEGLKKEENSQIEEKSNKSEGEKVEEGGPIIILTSSSSPTTRATNQPTSGQTFSSQESSSSASEPQQQSSSASESQQQSASASQQQQQSSSASQSSSQSSPQEQQQLPPSSPQLTSPQKQQTSLSSQPSSSQLASSPSTADSAIVIVDPSHDIDEQVRKAKQSLKSTHVNQAQLAFAETQAAGTQKLLVMDRPSLDPSTGSVFAQEIEDIVIYGSGRPDSSVERPVLESLLVNLPNLRSLEIWSVRQHPEAFVRFRGTNLRRLRLFGGFMSSSVSYALHHVLSSCPELEELEITSRALVGWNDADNFDLASRLLIAHPNLSKLRIAHSFAKPVKFLLPKLTRLVLEAPQRNFISLGKSPVLQKLSIQATPNVLANLFLQCPPCLISANIVLVPGAAPLEADSSILRLRGTETPPVIHSPSINHSMGIRTAMDDFNLPSRSKRGEEKAKDESSSGAIGSNGSTGSIGSNTSSDPNVDEKSVRFAKSTTMTPTFAVDFDSSGESSGEGSDPRSALSGSHTLSQPSSSSSSSSQIKTSSSSNNNNKSNRHRSVPRHVHRASLGAHLQKLPRAIDNSSKRSTSMVFHQGNTPANGSDKNGGDSSFSLSPSFQDYEITLRIESSSLKKLDLRIQTDKSSWPRLRGVQLVAPNLDSLTLQLHPSIECSVPIDLTCPKLSTLSTCLHPSIIHEVLPEPEIRFPHLKNFYLTLQDQDVLPIVPIMKNLSRWIFKGVFELGLSNISILTGLQIDGKKIRSLVLENLHTVPLFLLENLDDHLPLLEHLELKSPETEELVEEMDPTRSHHHHHGEPDESLGPIGGGNRGVGNADDSKRGEEISSSTGKAAQPKSSSPFNEDDDDEHHENNDKSRHRLQKSSASSTNASSSPSPPPPDDDDEDDDDDFPSSANPHKHSAQHIPSGHVANGVDVENPYYMQEEYRRMCPQDKIIFKSKSLSSLVCTLELVSHPEFICPNLRHLVYLQQESDKDLNVHSIFRSCPKIEKAYLGSASLTSCHISAPHLLRLKCVFGFVQPTWSLNTPLLERLKILRIRETPMPLRLTLTHATCPSLKRVTLCGVSLDSYSYNRLPETALVEELLISSKLDD